MLCCLARGSRWSEGCASWYLSTWPPFSLCISIHISVMFLVIAGYGFRVLGLELLPMFESKNKA
jgi:hypothetical protein